MFENYFKSIKEKMGKTDATPKFSVGDLVSHKTNPDVKLIVVDFDNEGIENVDEIEYECTWIDKQGKYHNEDMLGMELQDAK